MLNRGQLLIGLAFIVVGLVSLLGVLFQVDVGAFCFPIALILLGLWFVLRPRFVGPDTAIRLQVLGDIRRNGSWQVGNEEIWVGIADINLDMTQASIPSGETQLRVYGFVSDMDLLVPEGVGVSLISTAFVTSGRVLGSKYESVLTPLSVTSDDYAAAERKVRLEVLAFVSELKVKRV